MYTFCFLLAFGANHTAWEARVRSSQDRIAENWRRSEDSAG